MSGHPHSLSTIHYSTKPQPNCNGGDLLAPGKIMVYHPALKHTQVSIHQLVQPLHYIHSSSGFHWYHRTINFLWPFGAMASQLNMLRELIHTSSSVMLVNLIQNHLSVWRYVNIKRILITQSASI